MLPRGKRESIKERVHPQGREVMSETLTIEDFIRRIRKLRFDLDDEKIYFALRRMRIPHIRPESVETVAFCLALQSIGLRVTTALISALRNTTIANVRQTLHTLGDKGVLTMIRREKGRMEWILNPTFLRFYNE